MRFLAALLLALPAVAAAQSATADRPPRQHSPTLPSLGLPLAPIGLPLADITPTLAPLGLAAGPTPTTTASEPAPRRGQRGSAHRGGWLGPGIVYVVPGYVWGQPGLATPGPSTRPTPAAEAAPPATATLWIEAEPRDVAEIFVDGYFVGTADERTPVTLEPGRHRVELRAAGFAAEAVDVRADAGASLTLRRTLRPLEAPATPLATVEPAPAPTPIPRKPFYFIPGCYLGDVPPRQVNLPATCDLTQTVVVRP